VCVCAFSLRRESPDMILGDKPLIFEVVLSHPGVGATGHNQFGEWRNCFISMSPPRGIPNCVFCMEHRLEACFHHSATYFGFGSGNGIVIGDSLTMQDGMYRCRRPSKYEFS
jgi:hypothetical protein